MEKSITIDFWKDDGVIHHLSISKAKELSELLTKQIEEAEEVTELDLGEGEWIVGDGLKILTTYPQRIANFDLADRYGNKYHRAAFFFYAREIYDHLRYMEDEEGKFMVSDLISRYPKVFKRDEDLGNSLIDAIHKKAKELEDNA